jgi:hypothetical protein
MTPGELVVARMCSEIAEAVAAKFYGKPSLGFHAVGAEIVGIQIRREFGLEDHIQQRKPETLAEAIEKGRAEYMRVTGQTE